MLAMLAELRELDALQLGALTLCDHWPVDRVVKVEQQLIARTAAPSTGL